MSRCETPRELCLGSLLLLTIALVPIRLVSILISTMKYAALISALLASSASAFAPAQQSSRGVTSLQAEKSQALPFMNRPKMVSKQQYPHTIYSVHY